MKVNKYQLENKLRYFRKIHIFSNIYLVSLYGKTAKEKINLNVVNIIKYILSFVFIPVIVKEREERK